MRVVGAYAVAGLLLSTLLTMSACGSVEPTAAASGPGTELNEGTPAALQEIPFETCSLQTNGNDNRAECANVEVPLDWSDAQGSKVNFFVKRVVGTAPGAHRQVWLLQGGPGVAGDGLEPLASDIATQNPTFDVYIPDHRGTGRSAKLDCPNQRTRLAFDDASCLTELKMRWGVRGLATFSTTTAARDVGYVIEHIRTPGQEVHIYGVSYGTYWAQRYMQLFPRQPTAVVLDGVCQAGLCSYLKLGYWFDRVGKKYMGECAADATCAAKLGPDPVSQVRAAIARADAGTCAGLRKLGGEDLRRIFGWFIASFELRSLIPATTFRIMRCDASDVAALKNFENAIFTDFGGTSGSESTNDLSSDLLGRNIAFSELEEDPPVARETLAGLLADAVFTTPDATIRDEYDAWPRYAHDQYVGRYPSSTAPVLMMNGTLDPQTPEEFAETVAAHYPGAFQNLVLLPRASHAVVFQSPVDGTSQPTCGMNLWSQFLAAPEAKLDTSCRANILAHDFTGSQDLAQHFYGIPALWGLPVGSAPSPAAAPDTRRAPVFAAELRKAELSTRRWQRPAPGKAPSALTLLIKRY